MEWRKYIFSHPLPTYQWPSLDTSYTPRLPCAMVSMTERLERLVDEGTHSVNKQCDFTLTDFLSFWSMCIVPSHATHKSPMTGTHWTTGPLPTDILCRGPDTMYMVYVREGLQDQVYLSINRAVSMVIMFTHLDSGDQRLQLIHSQDPQTHYTRSTCNGQ